MTALLKAPFPYFGGKKTVAHLVWDRLGRVGNYIEPFAGSLAVLLLRPDQPKVETVNDLDCYLSNFWRATQQAPEQVVEHADGPVNECDLHARHRWLVLSPDAQAFRDRMRTDPDYFDPKIAGWWCWGLCCWIGSGWCDASQLERHANQKPDLAGPYNTGLGMGVVATGGSAEWQQIPLIGDPPRGEHRAADGLHQKRPHLSGDNPGSRGMGVHAHAHLPQGRPQLADAYDIGRGVNASPPAGLTQQLPRLGARFGNADLPGVLNPVAGGTCATRQQWLLDWFGRLRDRLRNVRVCCGDWSRVCFSESVTTSLGVTGVFLDPPYSAQAGRAKKLYASESLTVAHQVRDWCLERGADPLMRICLAGYAGEGHESLESAGWSVVAWESQGGYGNRSARGKANRKKERLWFSPHCQCNGPLFAHVQTQTED